MVCVCVCVGRVVVAELSCNFSLGDVDRKLFLHHSFVALPFLGLTRL